MEIAGILSFGNAWESFESTHSTELQEIMTALQSFYDQLQTNTGRHHNARDVFDEVLFGFGWNKNEGDLRAGLKRIHARQIGCIKNGVAAQVAFPTPDYLTRWLFNHTTLAVRHGLIELPILLIPTHSTNSSVRNESINRITSFEYCAEQLKMLSPLSVSHPFIIIGYTIEQSILEPEILELPRETYSGKEAESKIIDRSIEFPPEYQQAGLGILSFFASYLSEKYPGQDATVRIEQSGLKVRMVIESTTGSSEIIERALHEYELIVSGKQSIETTGASERLILDLRNELRIAKFRLESQQDIIAVQRMHNQKSDDQINTLMKLLGHGLSAANEKNITVQISPNFQNTVTIEVNQNISLALGNVCELLEMLPNESEALLPLKDLERSLLTIEKEQSKDNVRSSSAMSKFGRVVEQISDGSSSLRKGIEAIEQGIDIAKKLAENYNKIAGWCGLPALAASFF
ncbi:hypothetical protein [Pseudomonas fluorescens]|uniref:hypothetical protein n=1 Tax=Pseudomonas fluorescens TaxID=294 RepID=UPI00381C864A